ncbi:uncharacterized protein LOC141846196 [Curcuma longa]|uniref:uncharacterized protein LOC141846196 n=1 Tax=Curcuma longa TaxID=136217 RepID=UPI003D9DDA13
MVSKFSTRPSSRRSRSPTRHHSSGGKRSTPLSSPSPVKAAITRSVRSCRRRLAKLFSRLAVLGCASPSPRKRGFRRLSSTPTKPLLLPSTPTVTAAARLPPPSFPEKKTVFLDLDETMVHSRTDSPLDRYDFAVHPSIDGRVVPFYVLKRPGADELLRAAAAVFEVVVFTAGLWKS